MAPVSHEVFCGSHASILSFFEEREPTHVRVGKAYRSKGIGSASAGLSPEKTWDRTDHRVPQSMTSIWLTSDSRPTWAGARSPRMIDTQSFQLRSSIQ